MKSNQFKIKKPYSLLCHLMGLAIASYAVYFLLLKHDEFPFSIAAVVRGICNMVNHSYVLMVGILPIYIALIIFGLASVGLYLGSLLERLVARLFYHSQK
jgi:hypothetical protein